MKANQLKAGAMLSYLSMGIGFLISFVYTPFMIRLLGQSEYGLYSLVASVVAYLGLLNFGFDSAYMRFYIRYKVDEDQTGIAKLNGMFISIFSIIALIAVVAGSVLALNAEIVFGSKLNTHELEKAKILMFILVINLAISFPGIVFSSHITANERFVFHRLLQIVKTLVNPFITLPLLLLGFGSIGMVAAMTGISLSIEMAHIYYCKKRLHMQFSFGVFDKKLLREVTTFSSFIFINMVVDQVNWNVDKYLLGRFHGTAMVAIYGLAAQINTQYMSISAAISSVFIPRIHALISQKESKAALTVLFTRIGRIQFVILSYIGLCFIFFGRPFFFLWAGENYIDSYPILLFLVLPAIIPLTQNIGIEIQRALNIHQFRSWLYLGIAVLNIVISIPLARAYGGVGAAVGTALSMIIGNGLLMNWYNHRKVGLDMVHFWRQILLFTPALVVPIIIGIIANFLLDTYSIVGFITAGIFFTCAFLLSMWLIGLNKNEKHMIASPFRKLFQKGV